jgi:hypothetical protein
VRCDDDGEVRVIVHLARGKSTLRWRSTSFDSGAGRRSRFDAGWRRWWSTSWEWSREREGSR